MAGPAVSWVCLARWAIWRLREKLTWRDFRAVLRSCWLMGIVHRGRYAYWRLLTTTMLRHPRQIGVAITLAIAGHHFRRVAAGL